MQESQPLSDNLRRLDIDTCQVPSRLGHAVDKTKLDRVFADKKDNRDCHRCSFGCLRGYGTGCGDHGHSLADEVSQQFRQAIVFAFQPVILDRHVLALDVAGFTKAFAETGHITCVGGPVSDKSDYWHRRLLLRACWQWASC